MNSCLRPFVVLVVLALVTGPASPWGAPQAERADVAPLAIGIIGLDTSHVVAFTERLNDPEATGEIATMRVVAGYPGGTDIPASADRVAGFTERLRGMGVEIVDSIETLLEQVDVVLLESVDGRVHLEQARLVIEAGKPLFIDKPLAGSLVDVIAIDDLAKKHDVPWFSSSSLRFGADLPADIGEVRGCAAWGPCALEPNHPDLFWYGIHGVEALFTVMGPGCERVTRVRTTGTELVTGVWEDGRVGTFRGIRDGKSGYGVMVFGAKGIASRGDYTGYAPLVAEIAKFFRTGAPPVPNAVTLEIYAFMEAADESKRQGGAPVSIDAVMERARAQAALIR